MRVIGVIDLYSGQAVHASGGRRTEYQPVRRIAAVPIESGNAAQLAEAYIEQLGLSELYVADLDSILGEPTQDALLQMLAARAPILVDAAVTTRLRAQHLLNLGVRAVVVGLETLDSFAALSDIIRGVGAERVIFSLDLRDGVPVHLRLNGPPNDAPEVMAAQAIAAGARSLLVLDLARVGTGAGIDYPLVSRIRHEAPEVTLLVGGGINSLDDVKRLADVGCDGALVASALQSGLLTASMIRALHGQPTGTR